MKTARTSLLQYALLVLLVCGVGLQAAVAQQTRATQKHHQPIPAGKTCSSCHKMTYAQWQSSPHGANDVQCTVCHGEITAQTVAAPPAVSVCESCHSEQVAQLKSDSFMKGKTCVTCHPPHTFMPHKKAAPAGK